MASLPRPRTSSQPKSMCTHSRPTFTTKYKKRVDSKSAVEEQNGNDHRKARNKTTADQYKNNNRSMAVSEQTCALNSNFGRTLKTLQDFNFKHHNSSLCVCADCTCGRHLCQLHSIKPDFRKNTTYKKDYFKKKPIKNKIQIAGAYDKLQGPHLDLSSTYLKDFDKKNSQVELSHPEDLLKTGGPGARLTSYKSGFPGYKGSNQYVKPTDRHTRGYIPFQPRTTYSNSYIGQQSKGNHYERIPDSLKTGTSWFGVTSYRNQFREPNPEDYAKRNRITEKLSRTPNYDHQYETIYQNSFVGHPGGVCPAKVKLETKLKDCFSELKPKFSQNTDFKSLSPDFHAISTSQFHYI